MEKRDYSGLRNINIFDSGLFEDNAINRKYLDQNGIKTVEDLFEKDDKKEIVWGKATKAENINSVIQLARYKYLNEELYFGLGVNIEKRHSKHEWLIYDPGSPNGIAVNEKLGKNLKGFGFNIEYIIKMAEDLYDDEFSIADLLTNDSIITNFNRSNIPQSIKNHFNLVTSYIKEKREKDKKMDSTTNLSEILEEEKRLIKELEKLKEQSTILEARINEIQLLKQNNKSERKL